MRATKSSVLHPVRSLSRRCDADLDVLHQRLVALGAVVVGGDEDVHLGHVAGGVPAGHVIAQSAVRTKHPDRSIACGGGDVDEVSLLDAAGGHVGGVHQDQRAKVPHTAVAVVVGVDGGVPLVV